MCLLFIVLFLSPPTKPSVINEIIREADLFSKEKEDLNEKRGGKREWGSGSFLHFVDKRQL